MLPASALSTSETPHMLSIDKPSPPSVAPTPILYNRPLSRALARPTPFSPLWVLNRLQDATPAMVLANLRIFAHPRRRPEVNADTVTQLQALPHDDALRAINEFKNSRVFTRGTRGRKLQVKTVLTTLDTRSSHTAEALIDSGCEGSCINLAYVQERGIITQKLPRPIAVLNADGSPNEAGPIAEFVELEMRIGDHIERIEFGVTSLGRGQVFLGFDWLKRHNPSVDWREGLVEFDRCPSRCYPDS